MSNYNIFEQNCLDSIAAQAVHLYGFAEDDTAVIEAQHLFLTLLPKEKNPKWSACLAFDVAEDWLCVAAFATVFSPAMVSGILSLPVAATDESAADTVADVREFLRQRLANLYFPNTKLPLPDAPSR